jgi:glycosyltransferase involved in cell wall biosynthesis
MTEAVRTELVARHGFPGDRTWTAPLGLFLDRPLGRGRFLPTDRPIRLLFFGRILPYKGLDMLIEAFAETRKERPDVELEIWGSGDLSPYTAALAACSGIRLEHRWLDEQEIGPVFERTDICVLPYREASQSAVIATALASGMPVVTTPIPGLVEQIGYGKAGCISPDLSPSGFAKTILDLIASPSDYMRLSQDAVAYCNSTLGWPAIGGRIEAAARQLINLGRKSQP